MSSGRRVKTACSRPASSRNSGTRTAASVRPWTSSAAACSASSRTVLSCVASSAREGGALDTLLEHDLAVERAMHRALRGDDAEALDHLVAQRVGEAHDEVEAGRAAALGRRVVDADLDVADVPALALGVHLHRDRGARREARGEQLLRTGARVVAALVGGLVDRQAVFADLDRLPERAGAGGRCLHRLPLITLEG